MKILIGQPVQENRIEQLQSLIISNRFNFDAMLFPEGYLTNYEVVKETCDLAKRYSKTIVTGYLDEHDKDRALIINNRGEIVLDREKYGDKSITDIDGLGVAFLLCDELVLQGLEGTSSEMNLVCHPIGVGMFSEQQFMQWIDEARSIAKNNRTMMIGASHADGSYNDCGISIPIAYCIDRQGEIVFVSKNDLRPRILDVHTKEVVIVEGNE